ncbi:hypothetical protein [Mesorhizobium sp. L-2-11]|uniref:hypothetical protein n=1 Tax=Mesorhizobium sp. L-2-11 TaxID=2744521 RepID=UPI0019276B4A|nr:hypothetical protein [Mesorhizobium sp. L-2-11]BCH16884.1 hypothetical protein MesoLjLa_37350 [Mesorhizobium sp. L-2-11]
MKKVVALAIGIGLILTAIAQAGDMTGAQLKKAFTGTSMTFTGKSGNGTSVYNADGSASIVFKGKPSKGSGVSKGRASAPPGTLSGEGRRAALPSSLSAATNIGPRTGSRSHFTEPQVCNAGDGAVLPSPLVGEGGSARSAETEEGCWTECRQCQLEHPHPTSLREATFSHKGRRESAPPFGALANRNDDVLRE